MAFYSSDLFGARKTRAVQKDPAAEGIYLKLAMPILLELASNPDFRAGLRSLARRLVEDRLGDFKTATVALQELERRGLVRLVTPDPAEGNDIFALTSEGEKVAESVRSEPSA